VLVVNYSDPASLQHALMGVDTVISTVTGDPQLRLITAAVQARVRRFAPAEFGGLSTAPPANDPLDPGQYRATALSWLQHYRSSIESTQFLCGILYERFAPGGLRQHKLGLNSGVAEEGDYIINVRTMAAQAPVYDAADQPTVTICMTAAQDVARFVVRAIDMPQWPPVLTMYGERITVHGLTTLVQEIRGKPVLYCT